MYGAVYLQNYRTSWENCMNNKDWSNLFNKFYSNKIDFESNKSLFTKVAFDVYQLNSSPTDSLWILEDGEDGKQYLVATYDEAKEVTANWKAVSSKDSSMVVLCYKDFPVQKFASSDFKFDKNDVSIFERALTKKANSDSKFVRSILSSQPKEKMDLIINQFPELNRLEDSTNGR